MIKQESISLKEAQKLVLLSQGLPSVKKSGSNLVASLNAIEQLGYIQIDTISVIERAHHHTLWNRNPRYQKSHIDELIASKEVFEYWSHAAAYLPMRHYRFTLPRKQAIARGDEKHWYKRNDALMQNVLKRIEAEGPLMAKDFEHTGARLGDWEPKLTKQALDSLFMQGELMISKRINFHKVYDLTQRVIPSQINQSMPSEDEYARFLIKRFLKSNGIGKANEMAYLLKNTKAIVTEALNLMIDEGEVTRLSVNGIIYYAIPQSLDLLSKSLKRSKLKILSPFDNLLIQRKRTKEIFDFDYLLECYVPQNKRKFGYFALPILWDGKLVAQIDCKVDRKNKVLHILKMEYEGHLKKIEEFTHALALELDAFKSFNACESIQLHNLGHGINKEILKRLQEEG